MIDFIDIVYAKKLPPMDKYPQINSKIHFGHRGLGIVKFKGFLPDKEHEYYGIELDSPNGNHNGIYKGKRYFECPKNHGIFIPVKKICDVINNVGEATCIAQKYIGKYQNSRIENNQSFFDSDVKNEENLTGNRKKQKEIIKPTHFFSPDQYKTKGEREIFSEDKKKEQNKSGTQTNIFKTNKNVFFSPSNNSENIHDDEYNELNIIKNKENEINSAVIFSDSSTLDLQKLRLLYKTQKLYYKAKISDLQKKLQSNMNHGQNELKLENLKLKRKLSYRKNRDDKVDEFILGITRDCLKMKRKVDDVLIILSRLKNNITQFSVDKDLILLLKNLINSILLDDEENVQKYFRTYKLFMSSNGIECTLD